MFVLDASVAACWAFPDEHDARADVALAKIRNEEAIVPGIFWFELRNILVVNERRNRITESGTNSFLREFARLRFWIDREPNEASVLRLARADRLSVYDAAYLELAMREAVSIATLDLKLAGAATRAGVPLIGMG